MGRNVFLKYIQKYPLVVAIITQLLVLIFLRNFLLVSQLSVTPWHFIFWQALISSLVSFFIFRLPYWFVTISVLLPVCFILAFSYLHFSSSIYGIIFLVLALTFSHTLKERVPLYLTNNTTNDSLKNIIEKRHFKKVLDLGSGLGGVVRSLSAENIQAIGVESAPLLWIYSTLASLITRKGKILRQNIWKTHLSEFDLVYAFLSPAIMDDLFIKVKKEMKTGSVFVSNSFEVVGVKPTEVLMLDDQRKTKLFLYQI